MLDEDTTELGSEKDNAPVKPTLFETEMLLGIYCWVTDRVYKLEEAKASGTFCLLLKRVGRHFGVENVQAFLETAEELSKHKCKVNKQWRDDRALVITETETLLKMSQRGGSYVEPLTARKLLVTFSAVFNQAREQHKRSLATRKLD